MLRSVGERDFSSQETGHMLLSLPLTSCTFNFITVSLTNTCKVSKDNVTGEIILNKSQLHQYSSRDTTLAQLNLRDFFANYTVNNDVIKRRTHPMIIQTFPAYSSNPKGDKYGRFQLLKFHPWSDTTSFPWQSDDSTDQINVDSYTQFLRTATGRASIPSFAEELQKAERFISQDTQSDDEDENNQTSTEQEDWMVLCQLHQDLSTVSNQSNAVDWSEYSRTLQPVTIRESAKWIKTTKAESNCSIRIPREPVDISTLNTEQSVAYTIIERHCHDLTATNSQQHR